MKRKASTRNTVVTSNMKPEQDFVGPRGESDPLHRHERNQADGDRGQNGERHARRHALNGQHGIESVLDRLK